MTNNTRRHFARATLVASLCLGTVLGVAANNVVTSTLVAQVDPTPPPASSDILMPGENLVRTPIHGQPVPAAGPGWCSAYRGEPGEDDTVVMPCGTGDRYSPGDEDDTVAWCLVRQGYRGLPNDGIEAIYAPAAVIEACAGVSV